MKAASRIAVVCAIAYGAAAFKLPVVAVQELEMHTGKLDYNGYALPKLHAAKKMCALPPDTKLNLLKLPVRYSKDDDRQSRTNKKTITYSLRYNIAREEKSLIQTDPLGVLSKRFVSGNGGKLILEPRTAKMFARLERAWGERLQIRWAYRDKKLNRKVGGAAQSFHIKKMAIDVVHNGWSKDQMKRFVRLAYGIGFRGFGLGRSVIHIDTRPTFFSWNYGGNTYGLANRMLK